MTDWETGGVQSSAWSCCVRTSHQREAQGLARVAASPGGAPGPLAAFREERSRKSLFRREDGRGRDPLGKPGAPNLRRVTDRIPAVRLYASEISTSPSRWSALAVAPRG